MSTFMFILRKLMPILNLYHSELCFFCHRVRGAMKHMPKLKVGMRDIANPEHRNALLKGGGKSQVPCLLIEDGAKRQWMYESDDIVRYLKKLN